MTVQNESAKLVAEIRARIQPFLQPLGCCVTPQLLALCPHCPSVSQLWGKAEKD